MHISISTEYAIHSVLYMAIHQNHPVILVSEIAEALKIPESYLAKVFRNLAKSGLIRSFRGAKGGYSLGRSPAKITLDDLVKVIEGQTPMYQCLAERRGCGAEKICNIITAFNEAEERMYRHLKKVNFEDLKDFALRHSEVIAMPTNNPPSKRDSK